MDQPFKYDVTVSFAGEDRPTVDRLVRILRRNGVRVFYDAWEKSNLWGRDLYQHLDMVYRTSARYCLVFISKHYVAKAWAQHELRSAQARAFADNIEYILPIRLDDTELPGIPPTIAYLDTRDVSLPEIAQLFVAKLGLNREIDVATLLASDDPEDRSKALIEIAFTCNPAFFDRVIELMLSDPETDVREKAAQALDHINDPRAFPALVKAIHDSYFSVRSAAGWALVHLGADLVAAEMQRLYSTSDDHGAKEMARLVLQNL